MNSNWSKLNESGIWYKDNFFDKSELKIIDGYIESSKKKSKLFSSDTVGYTHSYTDFKYYLGDIKVNTDPVICAGVKRELSFFFSITQKKDFYFKPNYLSHLMLKFSYGHMGYELHAESNKCFGDWAYIVYLSSENKGELLFPAKEKIGEYATDQEIDNLKKSELLHRSNNDSFCFCEKTQVILPKRNLGVMFPVGLVHKVASHFFEKPSRFLLIGWPFSKVR